MLNHQLEIYITGKKLKYDVSELLFYQKNQKICDFIEEFEIQNKKKKLESKFQITKNLKE